MNKTTIIKDYNEKSNEMGRAWDWEIGDDDGYGNILIYKEDNWGIWRLSENTCQMFKYTGKRFCRLSPVLTFDEMRVFMETDYLRSEIACLIPNCGKTFERLGGHLRRIHNISTNEYKAIFPESEVISPKAQYSMIMGAVNRDNTAYVGLKHTDKTKDKIRSKNKAKPKSKLHIEHMQSTMQRNRNTKEGIELQKWISSKAAKLRRPTKPELFVEELLGSNWQYTGDGTFWIERYNPDFKHICEKKIIEVFGCRWHCCPECGFGKTFDLEPEEVYLRDFNRLKVYSEEGWETLIIWEHERRKRSLEERIRRFEIL